LQYQIHKVCFVSKGYLGLNFGSGGEMSHKYKEIEKKSWVEKAVPVFIVYLVAITILYAFHTVLCYFGIVEAEQPERQWISYNISLIIPVIIGVGLIHITSLFLSKKLLIGAFLITLPLGLYNIWFLYRLNKFFNVLPLINCPMRIENIEIAYFYTVLAICGLLLAIAFKYAYLGFKRIKLPLRISLAIIFSVFVIAYSIISNSTSIQKLMNWGRIEYQYHKGLFRGKYNAMRDLKDENVAILGYGLVNFLRADFDKKTGLKRRGIAGCVIDSVTEGYAKSYNNYVHEYIDRYGLPKNSKIQYSDMILNPSDYMNSDENGETFLLKHDTVAHSPDGNSSIYFPKASNYGEVIHKGKKFTPSFMSLKKSSIEIKWGPKGSELLFVRVNPMKKVVKVLNDYLLVYVIDLHDGTRINVVEDKSANYKKVHKSR
jgi:hypothetical protein